MKQKVNHRVLIVRWFLLRHMNDITMKSEVFDDVVDVVDDLDDAYDDVWHIAP